MRDRLKLKCWEIMQCRDQDCPTRSQPGTFCWEIARQSDDSFCEKYRVCEDCLAYLIRQETSPFRKEEIDKILRARNIHQDYS